MNTHNFDTAVVLDISHESPLYALTQWGRIEDWLIKNNIKYETLYVITSPAPHTILMDRRDAIIFKLSFNGSIVL